MPEVTLLGTGGMLPLTYRFLTSLYVEQNGRAVLIDCGEGTQVAFAQHGLHLSRVDALLITHIHADHVTGIPGLLLSLGNAARTTPLSIYAPAAAESALRGLMQVCGRLPYPVEMHLLPEREPVSFSLEKIDPLLKVTTLPLCHKIPCLGYRLDFGRKPVFLPDKAKALEIPLPYWKHLHSGETVVLPDGRTIVSSQVTGAARAPVSVVYTTDTLPIPEIAPFAKGADLFVCEGMYGDPEKKPSMNEKHHMLMQDACRIAARAGVKRLWLTHYSPAEPHPEQFQEVLREIFPEVTVSKDGESVHL